MDRQEFKYAQRRKRQLRVRHRVEGTPERPRLAVYRSLKHLYAQVIDDHRGVTLASASSLVPAIRDAREKGNRKGLAEKVGQAVAQAALAKGITKVVFDRRGYRYHGRVRALADGARKGGLQF